MKEKITIYEKAEIEINKGNLWRAKEIFQGNLGSLGYDYTLYEQYGNLLDKMGDRIEAGRFLFLSGKVPVNSNESIKLYLVRYTRKEPKNILGTFPKAARLNIVDEYPKVVAEKLKELGIKTEDFSWSSNYIYSPKYKKSLSDTLIPICILGGLLLFIVIGIFAAGNWLLRQFGS
jgi:hypothetical protein